MNKLLLVVSALVISAHCQASKILFPVPDSFELNIIADQLNFNGFELQPVAFKTSDSIEEIEQYYLKQWTREGIKYADIPGWRIISHLEDGMLYTVQIEVVKEGLRREGSVGYLGISNLPSIKKDPGELGDGFPKLSNTMVLNDIKQNDLGREARTLWMVNDQSITRNLNHIENWFRNQGWLTQASLEMTKDAAGLIMNKDNQKLDLSIQRFGAKTHILAVQSE
ncbi:MAG: hypothetical protein HWE13_00690 [Gammaproteobacteria bacterium]|nr:hypothetical protein [Gammaproteobacteria bacterium]NVK86605.1 hypothetical protein [Gammaproteobacteria bacterium]